LTDVDEVFTNTLLDEINESTEDGRVYERFPRENYYVSDDVDPVALLTTTAEFIPDHDADRLRHGAMGVVFDQVRAHSTLGMFRKLRIGRV
jgi:hypothetical protein